MVSIRMIIKLGPKNELQTLGFRTYYNQCVVGPILSPNILILCIESISSAAKDQHF